MPERANGAWKGIATSFGGYVDNGLTGAKKLQLPFVQSSPQIGAVDIIRRPQLAGANADSTLLFQSRLYSEATIRILLADTIGDLHPERSAARARRTGRSHPSAHGGRKSKAELGCIQWPTRFAGEHLHVLCDGRYHEGERLG